MFAYGGIANKFIRLEGCLRSLTSLNNVFKASEWQLTNSFNLVFLDPHKMRVHLLMLS